MLINPLKDFDLGEQVFQVGKQLEVKDQDARGLIDIGFAEIVPQDEGNKDQGTVVNQPSTDTPADTSTDQ